MSRKGILVTVLLLAVAVGGLFSGCARKSEESMTTVDSTLASGEPTTDAPEPGPTPGEQYNPPPTSTSGGGRTSGGRTSGGRTSGGSTSGSTSGGTSSRTSTFTVPAGTDIALAMTQEVSTKDATEGQQFTAKVTSPVVIDDVVVIPEGAEVTGHVVATRRSGKASGRSYMQLAYDEISFDGKTYNVASVGDTVWGKSGAGKDAAMIGGGAVAGAVLGKVLGGHPVKGAVIGGAAGTAASLMTRGPDVKIEEGQAITLRLDRSVTVTKARTRA